MEFIHSNHKIEFKFGKKHQKYELILDLYLSVNGFGILFSLNF